MTPDQLRTEIIRPVLNRTGFWSQAAENLLLGTAIHESNNMRRITQYDGGPALSYYQMEPDTLKDLYDNYLRYNVRYKNLLESHRISMYTRVENLTLSRAYSTLAARLQYFRQDGAIPENLEGIAKYWKEKWNTSAGKGTVGQFIKNTKDYICLK